MFSKSEVEEVLKSTNSFEEVEITKDYFNFKLVNKNDVMFVVLSKNLDSVLVVYTINSVNGAKQFNNVGELQFFLKDCNF